MAIDLEKYRKEPTTTGGATPSVDINKYRKTPVQTGLTFDVPVDKAKASEQKLQQYQSEQTGYDKEANKGFFSRFGKALVKNIAPSQVGLGKTLAGLLYQGSKTDTGLQESIAQGEQGKIDLLKAIRENEAKGVDATRLKQAYNEQEKTLAGTTKTARDLVQLPTTAQAVGQIGGTALDLLTAGTYGKAKTGVMSTGRLFTQTPAIKAAAVAVGAPEISNLATQQARGLFSRQGASNIAKGAIPGYASDVALGLQGERGEDREGANAFIPGLGTALGFGIPALSETTQTVRNIADPTSGIVEKRMSGLKDLETKNGKIARVFESADRKGVDVRKTLAETNLLNGVIDADGRISSDKALNNFNEFIQPYEGRVKEALNTEGRSIQLNQLADEAGDFINNSKLSDRQKVELQREIADNLDAFKQFRGNTVPVTSVHDTKVSLASSNNYLNPSKNIVDKEAARFFKEVVEKNTSSIDVAKYNKELSKYYTVREALEAMDRAVVSGGRMGKYFSSLIGTGVGGLAGGPIGAIVGAEAGAKVRGSMMSRAFGGDIKTGLQATPELIDALNPKAVGKQAIPDVIIGKSKSAIPDVVVGSRTAKPVNAVIPVTNTKLQAFKAGQGNSQGGYIVNPFQGKPKPKVSNQEVKVDLVDEAKKYKTTINIQDKNDIAELKRILSNDAIEDIKNGKMTNWRGTSYEDLAKVNIISETPKTISQQLDGRVQPYKLNNTTLWHGTSPDNLSSIKSEGFKVGSELDDNAFRGGGYDAKQNSISFSTDPRIASNFTGGGSKGILIESRIKPGANIVTIKGIDYAEDLNDFVKQLRKDGVDAVYLSGEKEVAVINKKVIEQSVVKSREFRTFGKDREKDLADIWNKANTPVNQKLANYKAGKTSPESGYIANPFQGKPKPKVSNQSVSSSKFNTQNNIRVPAEVRANIVEILDDYTLNGGKNKTLQEDAARIAEDFGITLPKRYGDLVKRLGEFLDKQEINRQVN